MSTCSPCAPGALCSAVPTGRATHATRQGEAVGVSAAWSRRPRRACGAGSIRLLPSATHPHSHARCGAVRRRLPCAAARRQRTAAWTGSPTRRAAPRPQAAPHGSSTGLSPWLCRRSRRRRGWLAGTAARRVALARRPRCTLERRAGRRACASSRTTRAQTRMCTSAPKWRAPFLAARQLPCGGNGVAAVDRAVRGPRRNGRLPPAPAGRAGQPARVRAGAQHAVHAAADGGGERGRGNGRRGLLRRRRRRHHRGRRRHDRVDRAAHGVAAGRDGRLGVRRQV